MQLISVHAQLQLYWSLSWFCFKDFKNGLLLLTKLKTKREKTSKQRMLALAWSFPVDKFLDAISAHALSLLAFMLSANSVHALCGQVARFYDTFVRDR